MKIKHYLLLVIVFTYSKFLAQTAPDFVVTDVAGVTHQLYADYLNEGTTVVIKFFFVACPPCNAAAPGFQQKYAQWGAGQYDVQFFIITDKAFDNNQAVAGFRSNHSMTMPGISADGGAIAVVNPYKSGDFGPWWGTPGYAVIAPDGTVNYGITQSQLDEAIAATGATGTDGTIPDPDHTEVELSLSFPGNSLPDGVFLILKPENASQPEYNLTQITNGNYEFDYPSDVIPEMENPVIELRSTVPAYNLLLNVADLVSIQRHILTISPFTNQNQMIAADVNGDGEIRVSDIVALRRVILQLNEDFPNNVPSYRMVPESIELQTDPGGRVSMNLEIIKMGNVN
jgi:peroxiredoxin